MEEKVTLKNGKLIELTKIYRKFTALDMDFDQMDEMMAVMDGSIEIETAIKVYMKCEDKLKEEAQAKLKGASEQESAEIQNDFIKKINALSEKESTLNKPLKKVSQETIKKAKLNINEYKVLLELSLV